MHSSPSIVYRALVTYSNERTGEIRVKIPSRIGVGSDVSISFIAREKHNNLWVVPKEGSQIVVSADDENMTNIFWLHSDSMSTSTHFRNYFEAYSTNTQVAVLSGGRGITQNIVFTDTVFSEGIRLVDSTKITFDYEGIYNLQYSLQWENTDSQAHDAAVWFSYNDLDYPNSSRIVSVPSKHGSVNGTAVTAGNFTGKAFAGDYIELHWSGSSTSISFHTVTAGSYSTLSTGVPLSPAILASVTQVA